MSETVDSARAKARAARSRLESTASTVKNRFSPAVLKLAAIDSAKQKAVGIALGAVKATRSRPLIVAGILAGTALALLHKPIIGAIRRRKKENDDG